MNMKRSLPLVLTLAALGTCQSASATNGYFTHGLGVKNKGMAGAGTASPSEVISAASNPAAAAMVGNKYEGGISVFSPRRSYKAGPSQANGNLALLLWVQMTSTVVAIIFPYPIWVNPGSWKTIRPGPSTSKAVVA